MRITRIKICNFRQYYGEQIIDIPNEKVLTIIHGENGAGKTNLLSGLTWCLYNEKKDYEDQFNDKVLYDFKKGIDTIPEMYIELFFVNENIEYSLLRKIKASYQNNKFVFNEEYFLNKIINGKTEKNDDKFEIKNIINNILTEAVKDYFFFDGSRIENFTKETHNKDVENAIRKLLKIETIKRANDKIEEVIKDIRKSIKIDDPNNQLKSINDELDNLNEEHDTFEKELENIKNEIKAAEREIYNIELEIKTTEENSRYKEELNNLKSELSEIDKKYIKENNYLNDLLKISYLCFIVKLMGFGEEYIKTQKKHIDYNPNTIRQLIGSSIDNNKCFICERTITEDIKKQLLNKLPNLNIENQKNIDYIDFSNDFINIKRDAKDTFKDINERKKNINELIDKKDKLLSRKQEVDKLIDNDLPDIQKLKIWLNDYQNKKYDLREKKREIEFDVKSNEKKQKEMEEEIKTITRELDNYQIQQKKYNMSLRIRDELKRIYNNYEKVELEKINEKTMSIFNLIIRKKNVFKKIFIDDQYKINVLREYSSENSIKQLSYGERQILSLSLISALAKSSGDTGPFVMDTPMGNLDPLHRKKLLDNISSFLEQVILLVTSSEFTSELYNICQDSINIEYDLKMLDNGYTQIERRN